jgi:hypothetical protein
VQSTDPEFAQLPVMSSHWRSTPLNTHDERPAGVPGALVSAKPPLNVRLIRMCWLERKTVPLTPMDGFEFVTHPFSEQSANVDRPLMFSVPLTNFASPWMTPVRVADMLEDPPLPQFVC